MFDPEDPGGYHEPEIVKIKRHCEVTAILVLYGLPRYVAFVLSLHSLFSDACFTLRRKSCHNNALHRKLRHSVASYIIAGSQSKPVKF